MATRTYYDYKLNRPYKQTIYDWMYRGVQKEGLHVFLTAPTIPDIKYGVDNGNLSKEDSVIIVYQKDKTQREQIIKDLEGFNYSMLTTNLFNTTDISSLNAVGKSVLKRTTRKIKPTDTINLMYADTCGYIPEHFHEWALKVGSQSKSSVYCFQISVRTQLATEKAMLDSHVFSVTGRKRVKLESKRLRRMIKESLLLKLSSESNDEVESIIGFDQTTINKTCKSLIKTILENDNATASKLIDGCIDTTNMELVVSCLMAIYTAVYFNDSTNEPVSFIYQYRHKQPDNLSRVKSHAVPYLCLKHNISRS